jgi:hypothetical protein
MSFHEPYGRNADTEFEVWKNDVMRRLRALETGQGLGHSAVQGAGTSWLTEDGMPIAEIGTIVDHDGVSHGGVSFYDMDGVALFSVQADMQGLVHPDLPVAWSPVSTFTTVTSATFVTTSQFAPRHIYHDVLWAVIPVIVASGTTGEIRLREDSFGIQTDALEIIGPAITHARFQWKHGLDLSETTKTLFLIEAQRTAGAGNVDVYSPREAFWTSSATTANADVNGFPEIVP